VAAWLGWLADQDSGVLAAGRVHVTLRGHLAGCGRGGSNRQQRDQVGGPGPPGQDCVFYD
jgi:hypothetical protein